jgi:hypothetical protein
MRGGRDDWRNRQEVPAADTSAVVTLPAGAALAECVVEVVGMTAIDCLSPTATNGHMLK